MQIDVARAIGAVAREVKRGEREGRATRAIAANRTYSTGIEDLWDALTNPERIPRWFAPVTGELKLGGRYQVEGNAGGTITACEPPHLIAMTWEFGGGVSWVTVMLEPKRSDETLLTLEHVAPVDPHWEKFGAGAAGVGWELGLINLDLHLASGTAISPSESDAWSLSQEGKAFARGSCDRWREAAIVSGEAPEQAAAAAERTRAFYSGELAPEG